METLFNSEQLKESRKHIVQTLQSGVFINEGNFSFTFIPLPMDGQLSPIFAVAASDINNDGRLDLVTGGNLYAVKPDIGRLDSSFGSVFLGRGDGTFTTLNRFESGVYTKGEVRDIKFIGGLGDKFHMLIARNNDQLVLYEKIN
jgi:hypothetical protein